MRRFVQRIHCFGKNRHKVLIVLYLTSLVLSVALASEAWNCPECGRTGNTGNYCGGCGRAAPYIAKATPTPTLKPTRTPTPKPTPKATNTPKPTKTPKPTATATPQNLSVPLLFHDSINQLESSYKAIIQDAAEWTMKTAPQKITDIILLPDNWPEILKQSLQVNFNFQRSNDVCTVKLTKPAEFALFRDFDECRILFVQTDGSYGDEITLKRTDQGAFSSNSVDGKSVTKRYTIQFINAQSLGSWFEYLFFGWDSYGNSRIQMEYQLRDPEGYQINWCIYGKEFLLWLYKPKGQGMTLFKELKYDIKTGKLIGVETHRD